MKKRILYSASVALIMACFTSCSGGDGPKWESPIPSGTYTDATGMVLSVNGESMIGKTAQINVDANNPSLATITLSSTFNLADIPNIPADLATVLEGPGVIPGSPVTVLDVTLTETQPGVATFAGNEESDYCTFEYSGKVTKSSIEINITNVMLKDQSLAGVYHLLPYVVDEWGGEVYSEPVYVKWESEADLDLFGMPMTPANLVKILMAMPLLNDMTVRIPDLLCTLLKEVKFGEDGNIIANYADVNGDWETPVYQLSPANMAQYVVTGSNTMRFWLNPYAVMQAAAVRADLPIDINNLLGNVIAQLAPMLKEGVPMRYTVNGENTTIYLDTETVLPLLKANVVPLLKNQELVALLVELVRADESMGEIADMLPSIIESAANVIENTTTLEIGMNLTTAAN